MKEESEEREEKGEDNRRHILCLRHVSEHPADRGEVCDALAGVETRSTQHGVGVGGQHTLGMVWVCGVGVYDVGEVCEVC